VALGQVFSENFGFPCQSTFHLLLHNHLYYYQRLAKQARSDRSANSLTNPLPSPTKKTPSEKATNLVEQMAFFKHNFTGNSTLIRYANCANCVSNLQYTKTENN
jgi:hypothetical protein